MLSEPVLSNGSINFSLRQEKSLKNDSGPELFDKENKNIRVYITHNKTAYIVQNLNDKGVPITIVYTQALYRA